MPLPQRIDRPLGPPAEPRPALSPEHRTFRGQHVTLRPLAASDADELFPLISGADNAWLFDYMGYGPFPSGGPPSTTTTTTTSPPDDSNDSSDSNDDGRAAFGALVAKHAASTDPLFYAAVVQGRVLGWLALMRVERAHGVAEVGHVLFAPPLQRTPAATEAVFLLAAHVFERLRYRRLAWKANDLNEASKRAAARLGFVWEGRFRSHMVVKGRLRDSAWYAMVEEDWFGAAGGAGRGDVLRRWLDGSNFDEQGQQKLRLGDM